MNRWALPMTMAALALSCATGSRSGGGRAEAIDRLMQDYTGAVPGASVLVLKNGSVAYRKSYGLADLEQKTAATPSTNYRLASVTKQFTAAAIMLLADRGELSYDDPITRYLPSLPRYATSITVRHLLTHTSGLLDYEDLIPADRTSQLLDRDVLQLLERQDRTYFEPGRAYRYSNTGYTFLALIVETVSGRTFASFLREEIFTPLGMSGTLAFENSVSQVGNRAFGYSRDGSTWKRTDQSRTSAVLGDGGIYSSIDDLQRWDQAIARGGLLSAETWNLAFTPHTSTDDAAVRYGFGWRISEHRGRRALWHSGETIGFRNVLVRFPEDGMTVIVLTNRNESPPYRTALAVADLFLD